MNFLKYNEISIVNAMDSLWFTIIVFFFFQTLYFVFYNRKNYILYFSLFSFFALISYYELKLNDNSGLFWMTLSLFFLFLYVKEFFMKDQEKNKNDNKLLLFFVFIQLVLNFYSNKMLVTIPLGIVCFILFFIFVKSILLLSRKRENSILIFIGILFYDIAILNNLFFSGSYLLMLFLFNLLNQFIIFRENNYKKNVAIKNYENMKVQDNYKKEFLMTAASELEIIVNRIENHSNQINNPGELNKLLKETSRLEEYIRNMNSYLYGQEKYDAKESDIKNEKDSALMEKSRRELYSSISHDLRTPLTSIKGYIEAIIDGVVADPVVQKEYLERVKIRVNGLIKLVEELSTIVNLESKNANFDFQEVWVENFTEKIYERYFPEVTSSNIFFNRVYSENFQKNKYVLNLDYYKMERVFGNLISNALRYTSSGGAVTLNIEIENNNAILSLTDTGLGIKKDDLPYVFDRFFTEKKNRSSITGNSGLGLSIAKDIVEAHKGKIWVESEEKNGTTFYIRIPYK